MDMTEKFLSSVTIATVIIVDATLAATTTQTYLQPSAAR
jgi:hypothetical protein